MTYSYETVGSTVRTKNEGVRKRIMAVDDERDITMTLKAGLEEAGPFEVYLFNNAQSALRSFKPNFYALVLIDVRMPYMDGFELYAELKKIDPSIKVCFLTASEMYYEDAREENHSDLREDVFIQKPISTDDLIMKINEKINSTQ